MFHDVPALAVNRYTNAGLRPSVHAAQLVATRVAGDVYVELLRRHEPDTTLGQLVLDFGNGALIPGNHT